MRITAISEAIRIESGPNHHHQPCYKQNEKKKNIYFSKSYLQYVQDPEIYLKASFYLCRYVERSTDYQSCC